MNQICATCKVSKPTEEYGADKRNKSGLKHRCRACIKVYRAQYYLDHKARKQELDKKWRNETALGKAYQKLCCANYRTDNEGYRPTDWLKQAELQNGRCYACGVKCELTMDHIVPISRGGVTSLDNIGGLCRSCNSRKHAKPVTVFLADTQAGQVAGNPAQALD